MSTKVKYQDFPFWEVAAKAKELTEKGIKVYQKFSCEHCGQRLGIEEPGKFHLTGTCDKCGKVTDIEKRGCNYMVHMVL